MRFQFGGSKGNATVTRILFGKNIPYLPQIRSQWSHVLMIPNVTERSEYSVTAAACAAHDIIFLNNTSVTIELTTFIGSPMMDVPHLKEEDEDYILGELKATSGSGNARIVVTYREPSGEFMVRIAASQCAPTAWFYYRGGQRPISGFSSGIFFYGYSETGPEKDIVFEYSSPSERRLS